MSYNLVRVQFKRLHIDLNLVFQLLKTSITIFKAGHTNYKRRKETQAVTQLQTN